MPTSCCAYGCTEWFNKESNTLHYSQVQKHKGNNNMMTHYLESALVSCFVTMTVMAVYG